MVGSLFPLPRTRDERATGNDPRLSIQERYASREDYLARIEAAARELVRSRYLLESDIPHLVRRATEQWEHLAATN